MQAILLIAQAAMSHAGYGTPSPTIGIGSTLANQLINPSINPSIFDCPLQVEPKSIV
jgi:hypothetical protein